MLAVAGGVRLATASVSDPTAPNASFTYSPNNPLSGDDITFTSDSTPGILDAAIQSEDWDLNNDGVYDDASGSEVHKSFSAPGSHTVGLKVTDALGATDV